MQNQVIPLFSTPLYHTNVGALDPITLAWINRLKYNPQSVADDNFMFLDHPKLKSLKENIRNAVNYYAYDVLDAHPDIAFEFVCSWLNRMEPGEFISAHSHKNAVISGVYYTKTSTSPISFLKSYTHLNTWPTMLDIKTQDKKIDQYTMSSFSVYPQAGDVLIFPSHLEHVVERNVDNEYRYSLAFNLMPRGQINTDSIGLNI